MTFRDGIKWHFIFEEAQQERFTLYLLRHPLQERKIEHGGLGCPKNSKHFECVCHGVGNRGFPKFYSGEGLMLMR